MASTESTSQQLGSRNHLDRQQTNNFYNHNNNSQSIMDPEPIDFDECLKDSPKFRQNLRDNLSYIENLENCMSKTIKQVTNYIETGREHIKAQKDFISSMRTLNTCLGIQNINVSKRVKTLLETLEEITSLHEIVIDQSARTVGNSLSRFINDDMIKIKDARKSFDKISHEYDQALTRYSVKKQHDDTENILIATSTAFTHTTIDLSIQLTTLQSKKGYDILDSLLSYTKAYSTFFHQGTDLFEDLKPHISDMDEFLSNIQDEFETQVRLLPSKHLMVSNNELRPLCFDNKAEHVHLEGYLFKRASNGFKVWNRRWFILKDHQLLYQKRCDTQPTIMEEDLRLLTVRPVDRADVDRRFCFEVLSPQKSHILQADTENACKTWISAIQAGINAAFHDTEYKIVPKSTSANELTSGATSSWGSSFSFKALHQQAAVKLNSIVTSSDHSGSFKDLSSGKGNKTKEKLSAKSSNVTSGDDEDDTDFMYNRVDEQGRSYVPLRHDDDEYDVERNKQNNDIREKTNYPAPASELSNNQSNDLAAAALATTTSTNVAPPVKPQRAYTIILAMPGNDLCADCGAQQPKWASINLGITLCIECAGIHRSLGVHLSKVRSLTLDTEVWSPEIVQLMLSLGNNSVNSAYLACYREQKPLIDADSCREDRENWIKSKYLLKTYMQPPAADNLSPPESSKINSDIVPSTDNDENKVTNDKKLNDNDEKISKENSVKT